MKDEADKHLFGTRVRLIEEDDILGERVARIQGVPKAVLYRMFIRQGLRKHRFEQHERSVSARTGNGSAGEMLGVPNYEKLRLAE